MVTEAQQTVFYDLSVALAIGLLVGLERGWHEREAQEGTRIAGVRTYGLIGLLGGVFSLLAEHVGALVMGMAFVGLAGVLATAYVVNLNRDGDVGITSLVAGLLTFALGALAVAGEATVASAFAVVTTLLLSYKLLLHRWVSTLEDKELHAGIELLLISVVLLPILPDRGYGPWQVLNPYAIWWMVVLIAAISFIGYFAIKIGGPRRGTVFMGFAGGLASSTALTLHFSRMARRDSAMSATLAAGVLLACGTMFPRMLIVASVFNPELFQSLVVPVAVMALVAFLPGLSYWRSQSYATVSTPPQLENPLELRTALGFGLLLALILLFSEMLQHGFGEAGVLSLATVSGVADVDAITLSLARMSQGDLGLRVAASGIVVAAATNSVVKGGMAAFVGGREIGIRVALPLLVSAAAGLVSAWLWLR